MIRVKPELKTCVAPAENQTYVDEYPDKTVPDMSIPLRLIIEKFSRGQIPDVYQRNPQYYEDYELPDIETMTLDEVSEYNDALKAHIKDVQRELSEKSKAKPISEDSSTEPIQNPPEEPLEPVE